MVGGGSPINADAARAAQELSFAFVGGVPHVAWRETSALFVDQIWVARLNSSGTAWERIGGVSPLNIDDAQNAGDPSIADVGGVPWVAWRETDGVNREVRVARLGAGGTWQEVGGGASPINISPILSAFQPSLASIGGVPHVAWCEGSVLNVRVARLNAAGDGWDDVGAALNVDPSKGASHPSITDVSGVPYVAWTEMDATNGEVRAARLSGGNLVQVEAGLSPINHDPSQTASSAQLATVGGVPHVAWVESDGIRDQVRVSRLNAAGNDWAEIVAGASPINRDSSQGVSHVSLASVGGAPYVAWIEPDGVNDEVRVSRLDAGGAAWSEVVPGVNPINASSTETATHVGMASIAGIPWVAWTEFAASGSRQVRVTRLEPEFGATGAVPTVNGTVGAVLFGSLHTYGLPYQAGFTVTGPGGGDTGLAPTGDDPVLLQRDVSGLTPLTVYSYRPSATAGVAQPRVLGPTGAFTTLAARATSPPPTPATDPLVVAFVDRLVRTRAGTRLKLRYVTTRAARATLELRRGSRRVRRFRANPRAGLNAFTMLAPTAGSYRLVLAVTTSDAKSSRATARLLVRKK